MQTIVGVNDAKTVQRWATALAVDTAKQEWFKRFTGRTENSIIHEKIELRAESGDKISFDLSMRLREDPVFGDDRVEGKEESLKFYTDQVLIDQMRKPVSGGGRMTRKRTLHDLRRVAKNRAAEYAAEWLDEIKFVYLSGAVGINEDSKVSAAFAGNTIDAPDTAHILYGGSATSKASITSSDKMTAGLVERCANQAKMMNARDPDAVQLRPVKVGSGSHYVLLMNPDQEYDMRTDTGASGWLEIQKSAAAAEGRKNPIFTGSLGMISNIVLHCHSNIRRFTDYGAGSNLEAARALFLGRQAGTCAFGTPGKQRMMWFEQTLDAGNEVAIYFGMIAGMKKTRFNNRDFGTIAVDTYAKNPNA